MSYQRQCRILIIYLSIAVACGIICFTMWSICFSADNNILPPRPFFFLQSRWHFKYLFVQFRKLPIFSFLLFTVLDLWPCSHMAGLVNQSKTKNLISVLCYCKEPHHKHWHIRTSPRLSSLTHRAMCVKNNTIICVARASYSKRDCEHDLYCCLLPRCEALRTCRSGFPIATKWSCDQDVEVVPSSAFTQRTCDRCGS